METSRETSVKATCGEKVTGTMGVERGIGLETEEGVGADFFSSLFYFRAKLQEFKDTDVGLTLGSIESKMLVGSW